MNEPLAVSALIRSVWHDFRRAWRALVVFEVLFKLAQAWLFVPAVALVLSYILSRAGRLALTNRDILDFVLSPAGLLSAALFCTVAVAMLLLEQAGIMVLVSLTNTAERPSVPQLVLTAVLKTVHVVQLSAVKVVLLALTFVPFVLLAFAVYVIFLTQHDIYFYWKERPPIFWLAAGIGTVLLLAALGLGMWLYVRWAFALPILLFEKKFAPASLRASRERVRGVGWRVGFLLLGWLLAALLVGTALAACFRLCAAAVLEHAGERPSARILLLVVVQGGLFAVISFVTVVGLGLLTRRVYLLRSEQLGLLHLPELETLPRTDEPASPWARRLVYPSVAIILLAPVPLWAHLPRYLPDGPLMRVTAHRGHARAAPENTLSAIRKAIASGADYAEVDVQQTGDGVVVLLHDRDLKRVAGVSRRLDELSFDAVRKLDVGSWFDPAFAGERVPTLTEVIDLSRGRIKLNIELKFAGSNRRLGPEVARLVREQDFESECLVTAFDHDALQEVKRDNPRLRTGLIVAHAVGDVSRLEFDVLSVRADHLSDEVLRAVQRQGREVHVWTVNDSHQMTRLMKRGVDNLITSDPDLAIRVRTEWATLAGPERLLLGSRLLLGLDPSLP